VNRRLAWTVVLVATFTMTVNYVDRNTLAVLAPSVTKALHIDEEAYGWLTSAFSFAYLFATPIAGWWLDRAGVRRGLVGSVLVWSVIAALHALVPGFAALFALRIALGIAEGPGFPGATQTVHRVLPPEDRARGAGVLFTGSSIGSMIAPLLAGFLFRHGGWRFAFLGTTIAGLCWVPLWILVTRRPEVKAALAAPIEQQAAPRVTTVLRHPAVIRGIIGILACAPGIGFLLVWGAKYLVATFAVKQGDVGDYLWLPPLCFDLGAIGFGDLLARTRAPNAIYVVGIVLSSALALLPWAATPWQAMGIISVTVAGTGALYTVVLADLLQRVPREATSLAGGIVAGGQSLALIIANPIIGRAVQHYHRYDEVAVATAAWVVPGSVVWLLWRPKKP
jgi:ACS family hexuronate transporter-like MFS transporter